MTPVVRTRCTSVRSAATLIAGILLLLFATLASPSKANASWSGFKSTGTNPGIGNPSCANVSSNHVVCAVQTAASAMMVNEYNGTAWGTWKALAGTISTNPTCTSDGAGKVYCAATATSSSMEVAEFTGSAWETPVTVTGTLYSAPSCAEYIAGDVLCVARNATGGLAWSLLSAGKWSAFANLGTVAFSAPNCTTDHDSGVICAFYTVGGQTMVNRFAAGTWKGFLNLGGEGDGTLSCTYWKPSGQVACFAKATASGSEYVTTFSGAAWSKADWTSYSNLEGLLNSNASCTTQASGELVCAVFGPDTNNALFSNVYNGTQWSGWTEVGSQGMGSPSCAPLTTDKVLCVFTQPNNQLTSTVGP